MGLSPQARGNRRRRNRGDEMKGSIPAGAGESRRERRISQNNMVYPRRRGGIAVTRPCCQQILGLSPQARGNHNCVIVVAQCSGSIPAGAGESCPCCRNAGLRWVYPRRRGGIITFLHSEWNNQGLSPQARGNRRRRWLCCSSRGSIPAGAGESKQTDRALLRVGVYPRRRGGIDWPVFLVIN